MSKVSHWFRSFAASFFWAIYQKHWRVEDVFDNLYEGQEQSDTFRRIHRDAQFELPRLPRMHRILVAARKS